MWARYKRRLEDIERSLAELSEGKDSRRWFKEPAWWSVGIALIAVLASLYTPVWKPLFASHPPPVVLTHTVVMVTPYRGRVWLQAFVTLSNQTSSVVHLNRVEAATTYRIPHKRFGGLVEGLLCPVVAGLADGIPPHDSIQYSAQYELPPNVADENSLRTRLTVRPAFGKVQSTAKLTPTRQTATSAATFAYACPDGTFDDGGSPLPAARYMTPTP